MHITQLKLPHKTITQLKRFLSKLQNYQPRDVKDNFDIIGVDFGSIHENVIFIPDHHVTQLISCIM